MAKATNRFPPYLLASCAAVLLSLGWLVPSLQLLIFVGFVPLLSFAQSSEEGRLLEKMEWVLLSLTVPLLLRELFSWGSMVMALVVGIGWTLAFVAHSWVRHTLGVRTGIMTLIFFWLSVEYIFLKYDPAKTIFLADSLEAYGTWTRWTTFTGYLGTGAWILLANWAMYKALLDQPGFSWGWLTAGLMLVAGLVLFSLSLPDSPVARDTMVKLYEGKMIDGTDVYLARGEWVVRTAAWISLLILLFTAAKSQTRK